MKRSPFAALTAILAAALLTSGLAAGLVLGLAGPALAHDTLKSSSPAKNAEVTSLDEVKLEFSAKVRMPFVIVRGDGDAQHQSGKPEVDGAVVTQAVKGPLPDGKYTIAYRVVSSDGHPIEGEIPFRVKGAEPPSPSPSPSPSASASPSAAASASAAQEPAATVASSAPAASPTGVAATEQAAAEQGGTFPVWLIIVIGALVGIGIGFLLSARKKQP
ncbi:copper resistance CopC family protein [Nonomuraea gerenzanensis]|uniref:Copper resistance protein CopC n=1 Tax=Nonomuraea gerenzanensis TaxID=93944 RepID=A0A1M4E6D7_9ACTN|nr:copper resistance CopC family protein [Nonomuraea gerenzanensis]UBU16517.1 copper resistance protein CopC [Nonomuraea gerenzanensis]SBO94342.1 Copper resistance protein CopC [Nonomuraea gerenzanensis]